MKRTRTYTIRLAKPLRVVSVDGKNTAEVTQLVVTVMNEGPYRAPENDVTHVTFRTKDGELFDLYGQVDPF